MTTIMQVFWWDEDRRAAGLLVESGGPVRDQWADVYTFDEMWERCKIDGAERAEMTRFKLLEFIRGMTLVIIEKGEARYTSNQL